MKIQLLAKPTTSSHSTLVVFAFAQKKGKEESVKIGHPGVHKLLQASVDEKVITGKSQEVVLFRNMNFEGHTNVLVVGAGSKLDHEAVRQLAACTHGGLKSAKTTHNTIDLDGLVHGKKEAPLYVQAFAEGLLLTDYNFDEMKSKKEPKEKESHVSLVTKFATDSVVKKALTSGQILAETVNFSRRLGDMPGNFMTPSILAKEAESAAKGTGIKTEIWDKARIKKEKMGGLLGVSMGSDEEPRFIIMKYNGAAKTKKPIVFVGKGLTFDCGGVSIKPGAGMEEMKYDMCGGANVIGTLLAIAKLKLKVNAVALVPSTENMVNGSATKPGDIHTARNGKTFEVNNTDAEGRLILSDALCYATELEPQMIVDAATLTGAIVVALGNTHTGVFSRNDALCKKITTAAEDSGEWVWRMPLCDHHLKDMKGTYADLSNISSGKGAGSATAAAFLEQFVGEGIPWAHFDIAGTAWSVGNRLPYCPKKGASGAMIRTFVELAKQYE